MFSAGHGNRAVQNIARAGLESAQIEYARLLDRTRREVVEAHARTAADEEKPRMWQKMVGAWPDYDAYQEKTDRQIPIVVLERL